MSEPTPLNQKDPSLNVRELINDAVQRVDDLARAKDIQYQFQFLSAKEAVGIALIAQEKAVAAALEGTREAINKADVNTDKRFSLLSEKIDGITSTISKSSGERGIYVTHVDLNVAMDKLQSSIEATLRPVVTFMNSYQGGKTEVSSVWGYVVGGISLAITIILFSLRMVGK